MFKHRIANILGAFSLAGAIYCFGVFLNIQPRLTPAMPVVTKTITDLANWMAPAYFFMGIYHLLLLVNGLKTFHSNESRLFGHSLYVVALILSGITLLTDVTLLSDIGKEYLLWDVQGEWAMLYVLLSIHVLVMAYGTYSRLRSRGGEVSLFRSIQKKDDLMFLAVHQVGLICAGLGLAGVIASHAGNIPQRYQTAYMHALSILAIVPLVSFLVYWLIRKRREPVFTWFDEKQVTDSGVSALMTVFFGLPFLILLFVMSILYSSLPASFWLALAFFVILAVYSGSIVLRNRITRAVPDEG